MRVGGIPLAGRHVHDGQREVLGGNRLRVPLAGGARADEAMLGAAEAFHARVRESIPVGDAIVEAGDAALELLLDFHVVLRSARGGALSAVPRRRHTSYHRLQAKS